MSWCGIWFLNDVIKTELLFDKQFHKLISFELWRWHIFNLSCSLEYLTKKVKTARDEKSSFGFGNGSVRSPWGASIKDAALVWCTLAHFPLLLIGRHIAVPGEPCYQILKMLSNPPRLQTQTEDICSPLLWVFHLPSFLICFKCQKLLNICFFFLFSNTFFS